MGRFCASPDRFCSCDRTLPCMILPDGTMIEKGVCPLKTWWACTRVLIITFAVAVIAGRNPSAGQGGKEGGNPKAIPVASEPHHHLSFQNHYVRVFEVRLAPQESTLLHQHDSDYIYFAIGDAQLSTSVPGEAITQVKLKDREVGFTRGGFAHVVHNGGNQEFRVTDVDLVQPQGKLRNLCLQVVADEPLACPEASVIVKEDAPFTERPEFETQKTRVVLVRLRGHGEFPLSDGKWDQLVVSVDESVLAPTNGKGPERLLHPGDFAWLGRGGIARVLKNHSDKEAWIYRVEMRSSAPEEAAKGPIVGAPLAPKKP